MNAKAIAKEFRLECQLRRLSERTIRGYYNNVLQFLNFVEKEVAIDQIEDIHTTHIKQYVQYLLGKKLTPSYANGIIKCLRAYFKFAYQEEYIRADPTQKVNWQREPKVLIQTFHDNEVRGLLS